MANLKTPQSSSPSLWKKLSGDWHLLQDTPLSEEEIRGVFSQSGLPVFHYYILLVFATAISTLGLLTDSAATIIGGMLIAPLMSPIMTLGFSTVRFEVKLIQRSLFAVTTGIILIVAISYGLTTALGLRLVDSEILSRTHPNLLDLGVAIAAGAAGAFAFARPKIANAVPGAAIAVALVPPLCVVGIALASGSIGEAIVRRSGEGGGMAAGAFLLFATNVVGIIFSAGVVFKLHGYGEWRQSLIGLCVLAAGLYFIVLPLKYSFRGLFAEAAVHRSIERLKQEHEGLFTDQGEVVSLDAEFGEGRYHIKMDVVFPSERLPEFQSQVDLLSGAMSKRLGRPVDIKVRVLPAQIFQTTPDSGAGGVSTTK